jgi:branched-chain amino acid aminotransferase
MKECLGKLYVLNGQLTDTATFDDSFLNQPHYIYEVFRVIEGVALFLEDHLERLEETCRLANHSPDTDFHQMHDQVYQLIKANTLQMGNIKVVMVRTPGDEPQCMIYITEHQYPTLRQFEEGVDLSLFRGIRHNPNAKVMDAKLRRATNEIKKQKDVYETLLIDEQGCITEGSRSNVFFIRQNKIITPPLEDVLPGITRRHVIEVCKHLSLPVSEEKVLARSLVVMEGVFISGTSRKVLPAKRVDELSFDPKHPLILLIREAFEHKVQDYTRQRNSGNPSPI